MGLPRRRLVLLKSAYSVHICLLVNEHLDVFGQLQENHKELQRSTTKRLELMLSLDIPYFLEIVVVSQPSFNIFDVTFITPLVCDQATRWAIATDERLLAAVSSLGDYVPDHYCPLLPPKIVHACRRPLPL